MKKNDKRYDKRLVPLFIHYGIDPKSPDAHMALVICLAQDFVPGFKIVDQAGNEMPRHWAHAQLMAAARHLTPEERKVLGADS